MSSAAKATPTVARYDLLQAWYEIMRCIRELALRLRCKALTWQELAAVLPDRLQQFLEEKYGIARMACFLVARVLKLINSCGE